MAVSSSAARAVSDKVLVAGAGAFAANGADWVRIAASIGACMPAVTAGESVALCVGSVIASRATSVVSPRLPAAKYRPVPHFTTRLPVQRTMPSCAKVTSPPGRF